MCTKQGRQLVEERNAIPVCELLVGKDIVQVKVGYELICNRINKSWTESEVDHSSGYRPSRRCSC